MSATARPTESPPGDDESTRQDRRLLVVLLLIIAFGTAAMAILAYTTG